MNTPQIRGKFLLTAILVAAVTFFLYGGALKNDFIGWDDDFYILSNPYISPLSAATVWGMASHFYFQSWTPLTLLVHAIDFRIWGLDPRGHHLTNMIFHALNSVWILLLSVALLKAYRRPPEEGSGGTPPGETAMLLGGAAAALFFGFHPLRVEAVACASSLKDLLSTFLALPSILLYLVYAGRRGTPGSWRPFAGSLILYGLSLLAKGSVMTLAGLLLLIDAMAGGVGGGWARWRKLLLEKMPYLALGLLAAVVAYSAALVPGTTEQALRARSDYSSLELGMYNCSFYFVKTLWPANLAELYSYPLRGTFFLFSAAAPAAALLGVILWRKGYRALLYVLCAYVVAILPMAGFVPSSIQVLANRYAYFAAAPFCVLFGAMVAEGWTRARVSRRFWAFPALLVPAAGILALLGNNTARHVGDWRDAETVWRHAIAVSPFQSLAHNELGRALAAKKQYTGALASFSRAIEISPEFTDAQSNMGGAYVSMGDSLDAERVLGRALALSPGDFATMINLGNLRVLEKRYPEAVDCYTAALSINPESAVSAYNLGYARMMMGRPDEALAMLRRALSLNPNLREAYFLLGEILSKQQGGEEEAVDAYRHAARLGYGQAQRILISKGKDW